MEKECATLMLDASPLCCQLWDGDFRVIDCNEAAMKLFGFENKREYLERWAKECSPECQPDGLRSEQKSIHMVKKAFREGRCVFSWMGQRIDGTPIPLEITLVRISRDKELFVAGYMKPRF